MGYFSHRTLERLRQIGDSSLNHENTPTGDRESINMDTVWEETLGVKQPGDALRASASQMMSDCNMLKARCSTDPATVMPPCKQLFRFILTLTFVTLSP